MRSTDRTMYEHASGIRPVALSFIAPQILFQSSNCGRDGICILAESRLQIAGLNNAW